MLVKLISNCYYDTPIGSFGIIIKEYGKRVDPSDDHKKEDSLFLVRFSNNEEEVVWKKDLKMIQSAHG